MGEADIFDFESRRLAIEWESVIEMMETPLLGPPFDSSNSSVSKAKEKNARASSTGYENLSL